MLSALPFATVAYHFAPLRLMVINFPSAGDDVADDR
jgi:hypothetical protein